MPKGVYQHKPQQGFQKGHPPYTFEGRFKKGRIPWNKGKKCGSSWNKGKHPEYVQGKNNYFWKGGKTKHTSGYAMIHQPDHPRANKDGYVKKCYLVIEKKIKRLLRFGEVVHHRNEDPTDDRLCNLVLCCDQSQHMKKYHSQRGCTI